MACRYLEVRDLIEIGKDPARHPVKVRPAVYVSRKLAVQNTSAHILAVVKICYECARNDVLFGITRSIKMSLIDAFMTLFLIACLRVLCIHRPEHHGCEHLAHPGLVTRFTVVCVVNRTCGAWILRILFLRQTP
jgi:hypothetical protein